MSEFLQQLVNGVTWGSVYALIALGYTMVYGILRLINFAHGDVYMLGAFFAYYAARGLGAAAHPSPLMALVVLLIAMAGCGLVGLVIERAAYKPVRRSSRLAALITAIGVSLLLENGGVLVFGADPKFFPQIIPVSTFTVAGATLTGVQVAIFVICLAMMGALALLVYRTRLGRAMRATAQNPQVAGLMGVDINRVISATFVIGAGLAAVAGVMVGSYYGIAQYTMGSVLGLKAFCAAVLGGIGNIPGAMLGGVVLGIVEALGAGYIGDLTDLCRYGWLAGLLEERCAAGGHFILFGSNYQDVFAFVVLILVLVFRPSGLLGERVGDRA